MLASAGRQTFGDWEHCLVDDNSDDPEVRRVLDEAAASDPRIRVHYRDTQGGIVAASNDALQQARGEYVAFLDHDDELDPWALEKMAAAIADHPDADYLYSDEDKIDRRQKHFDPFVKSAWSPDRLRCQMYVTHFRVVRRSLIEELGGLRHGFDGSQDWDLALRVSERTRCFVHVPGILYHWRATAGSAAVTVDAKPWAHEASQRAIAEHVERTGIEATVETVPGYPGRYWLRPALVQRPLVSIVIPTAARSRDIDGVEEPLVVNCVRSVVERTSYDNYELVIVADGDTPETVSEDLRHLAGERLRLVTFEEPFNFSAKVNLGVRESTGEQILLLNDDVEVLPPGWRPLPDEKWGPLADWGTMRDDRTRIWLESMLAYAIQPGVGAIGAKLFLPNGRIQHAGVVGWHGIAGHPYYLWKGSAPGYQFNLLASCNFLAVTAACLMTPRAAFESVGGFDEAFPVNYNDVDYCLKLHEAGLRSVVLPEVELLHYESVSRGKKGPSPRELEALNRRWDEFLENDPYYPQLFLDPSFSLPPFSRRGGFRKRRELLSFVDPVLRAYDEGGVRLVTKRAYPKLRRMPRGLARRLLRSRQRSAAA
jgi:GT2 family glycosyltransferase